MEIQNLRSLQRSPQIADVGALTIGESVAQTLSVLACIEPLIDLMPPVTTAVRQEAEGRATFGL